MMVGRAVHTRSGVSQRLLDLARIERAKTRKRSEFESSASSVSTEMRN
jgi:hypothetical protein